MPLKPCPVASAAFVPDDSASVHGHDLALTAAIGLLPPSRKMLYVSVPSSRSLEPSKETESTPADVLVTVGWPGRPGTVISGPGEKTAKPCWPFPFTVLKSPPRKSLVPSVAITLGPRLLPSVFGVQCPSGPSVSDWVSSRCSTLPPAGFVTCGKPPGEKAQSWACEPL